MFSRAIHTNSLKVDALRISLKQTAAMCCTIGAKAGEDIHT